MQIVKVALIGAGSMATTFHYPSLAEFPDVELVGLCDLVAEKGEKLGQRLGIQRLFTDYRKMLDETQPDAVYILMPPHHLFDMAIDALKRGLHVFVEKPPAVTTFQTHAMARTAAEHDCITMVGFNRRHDPLINASIQAARQSGPITQVQASFFKRESAIYWNGAVDVIGCDAIHAVDAIRYMACSSVKHVQSTVAQYESPIPNAWNALVAFDSGVVGILQSNWSTGGRHHSFEIHSLGYSGRVEQLTSLDERTGGQRRQRTAAEVMGDDAADPRKLNGFYQQARHFVDCIREHRQPTSSFDDAVETMRLVDAIRLGYPVNTSL